MRRTFLAVSLLLAAASACLPARAKAQVPEPVADLIPLYQDAFNAGDGAAVANLYAKDAVRLPPEGPELQGQKAIAADVVNNYGGTSIVLRAVGGLLDGDVATLWGVFELHGTDALGEAWTVGGRWMNALKKTDDGWKIYRDIWNFGPEGD
jgi:uncharacterized protein (TIGR02246 family)